MEALLLIGLILGFAWFLASVFERTSERTEGLLDLGRPGPFIALWSILTVVAFAIGSVLIGVLALAFLAWRLYEAYRTSEWGSNGQARNKHSANATAPHGETHPARRATTAGTDGYQAGTNPVLLTRAAKLARDLREHEHASRYGELDALLRSEPYAACVNHEYSHMRFPRPGGRWTIVLVEGKEVSCVSAEPGAASWQVTSPSPSLLARMNQGDQPAAT